MKKIFLILLILVLLAGIALAVFLAAFDLDRYRPGITRKLEEALKKPVKLEKITLGWHEGLALDLQGFTLYSDSAAKEEIFRLKSLGILGNPWALLNRKVEISSIFLIQPELRLIRNVEGKFLGFETKSKKKFDLASLLAAASLSIDKVKFEKGKVLFRDESRQPPLEAQWEDIQVTLKNVAWNKPAQVEAEASFLSPRPNLNLNGQIRLTQQALLAENVRLEGDFDSLDWNQAAHALPFLHEAKIQKGTGGKLLATLPSVKLDEEGLKNLNVEFQLQEGRVLSQELGVPIEEIHSSARITNGRFEIENLGASLAGGRIQITGIYNRELASPLASLQLKAEGIHLDKIAPASSGPKLEGRLGAVFQGTLRATKEAFLISTLAGQGTVRLDDAVIRNFNFLKEVFSKISFIPGLVRKLEERLPEDYQDRLVSADTYLNPIELPFAVNQGVAGFNGLSVVAASFELTGTGQVNLVDRNVFIQTMLYVEPDLSRAVIASVNELQYLAAEGRLQIPITLRGTIGNISMTPEFQHIIQNVAVSKAADAVNEWLFKKKKDGAAPEGQQDAGSGQQGFNARNLFGALLQGALQPRDSSQQN